MGRLLFAVFLFVPLIEIGLFISIGQWIGIIPTLLGVVVTALLGSAIIRLQGLNLIADIRRHMGAGALPARQLAEGMMLGISGALLLTPGYFTDAIGFLLLVPPVRTAIYEQLRSRVRIVSPGSPSRQTMEEDVIDLDPDDWRGKGG